jgi:hypothetical protein
MLADLASAAVVTAAPDTAMVEDVPEGMKAAKVQHSQHEVNVKAAVAAMDGLLTANGLTPVDIKAYVDPKLIPDARRSARGGRGLSASKLKELQEGLATVQAEGVLEGIKAAKEQQAHVDAQRKADTKVAATALNDLMSAHGLLAPDVKGIIDPQLVYSANTQSKPGGRSATRLEKLREGLVKLQAEGVLEGICAAKVFRAQAEAQRYTDTKVAAAVMRNLMSANGLLPVDIKGYIDSQLVHHASQCASSEAYGLPAAKLKKLQEGLAKLQGEGVLEGIKVVKVQRTQADSQRKADTTAAAETLNALLSANGLVPVDIKGYIRSQLVHYARQCASEEGFGLGLPIAKLEELQAGLVILQGEGVMEAIKAAKEQRAQKLQANSQRKTDTKVAAAALRNLLDANGLLPADIQGYIGDSQLVLTAKLEELQEGLAKLQAEGVLEGIKAAKEQQEQVDSQHKADIRAAAGTLDDLLRSNGLVPADIHQYMDPKLVLAWGWEGRTSGKLEMLHKGLVKLRAKGVLQKLSAAKAQITAKRQQADELRGAGNAKRRKKADAADAGAGADADADAGTVAAAAAVRALGAGAGGAFASRGQLPVTVPPPSSVAGSHFGVSLALPGPVPSCFPGLPSGLPTSPGLGMPMPMLSVEQLQQVAPMVPVAQLQQMMADATNKTKRMMEAANKAKAAAAGSPGASGSLPPAGANGEAQHKSTRSSATAAGGAAISVSASGRVRKPKEIHDMEFGGGKGAGSLSAPAQQIAAAAAAAAFAFAEVAPPAKT